MRIDSVDFFYLRMPVVLDIGDGSQDALLVRVRAGNHEGWGECEASPLTSIASWVAPMSHSACKPVSASVVGRELDGPEDIRRLNRLVQENSFDLLQWPHTFSGIDVALWDLLGRKREEPVWKLLDMAASHPKRPYASQLFGDRPEETYARASETRKQGFTAAKFGWGPYGRDIEESARHLEAARAGLGDDVDLMVDVGTLWKGCGQAMGFVPAVQAARVVWLEEPFPGEEYEEYRALSHRTGIPLAGGEGCDSLAQAVNFVRFADPAFLQIDAGRIGGITPATFAASYAAGQGARFVNHTFTSSLALSASLQPYANHRDSYCEYPLDPKPVARDLTASRLVPDPDGLIRAPDAPGLGLDVDLESVERYLVEVEINVGGRTLFRSDRSMLR
ncbi:MAG TPA: mandelate racemase/muconate lactonizing enzyme family protein [Fimbriimonas sp.]